MVAQGLYAFGACLCLINTYVSIVFIVLVQLNFALAPRLPFLSEVYDLEPLGFYDVNPGRSGNGRLEQSFGDLVGRDYPVMARQDGPQ